MDEKTFYTTKDVMRLMRVSRSTAEKLGRSAGALVHIGKSLRYDAAVLDAYLDGKRQEEQTVTR